MARQRVLDGRPVSVVRRYTMSVQVPGGGARYGFGAIDLCDECWEEVCQPKQRPTRGTPRKHPSMLGAGR